MLNPSVAGRHPARLCAALAAILSLVGLCAGLSAPSAHAAPSGQPQCADPFSGTRDAANPLMLPSSPGANPLQGANFFVDGPAHGDAAGAIAQTLGMDTSTKLGSVLPSFSESEPWTTFVADIASKVSSLSATDAHDVVELSKIASEPEVQKVSSYSQGGGPGAIYSQTEKLFCHNFTADPGSVPIIMTYFLHASLGGCATPAQMQAYTPTFQRRVNELAQAIGNRPAVLLLEEDAYGSSHCMAKAGDLGDWEKLVRYEVDTTSALPHAVVYVEAGYSDSNSPAYTARALNASDISKIQGFYTNDTHLNWTSNEIKWGDRVSALTHGKDFIVNTAQNGNGPLIEGSRVKHGNEVLCNPPGRALGPKPTTDTGFPHVDAFLWTSPPGNSSGPCNGGTPSGTFWAARAIQLASDANGRLGPGGPSQPY